MADSAPVTILNFGPVLEQILAVVTLLQADRDLLIQNQNAQLGALTDISNAQGNLEAQGTALEQVISNFNMNVLNLNNLVQSLVAGLSSVATANQMNQALALLNQILEIVTPTPAVSVGLDTSKTASVLQPTPVRPGA